MQKPKQRLKKKSKILHIHCHLLFSANDTRIIFRGTNAVQNTPHRSSESRQFYDLKTGLY